MLATALAAATSSAALSAQQSHDHGPGQDVTLHLSDRWKECSIQLDPSLTQVAWHQFTNEAGLVTYFRPLLDARPLGKGHFELALLQWQTGIDATEAAWNDTFVHPDSTHWLVEGSSLAFPGLMVRAGVTDGLDVGAYVTKSPGANYGFFGGQVQYNVVDDVDGNWAASTRLSFASMYGPEDLGLAVYGADVLASRRYAPSSWAAVSPYVGVSAHLSSAHETTSAVALDDENVTGAQAMVGAVVELSKVRLAAEYNVAAVNSFSMKVGVSF